MTTATERPDAGARSRTRSRTRSRWGNGGRRHDDPSDATRLARGLGWFSIGLGLAQLAAPDRVARLIGIRDDDDTRNTMRAIGLREITSGVGILARPDAAGWLWSRAGGDVMDLAILGRSRSSERADRDRLTAATAAVVGVTILDVLTGQQLGRNAAVTTGRVFQERAIEVTESITVNRSPEEVYRFWRDFQNLPHFMAHLESVETIGDRRSKWKAKAPLGRTVEWEAEITDDRPNERIAWRSLEGADVSNTGSVRFVPAPGGRGTEIHVEMRYDPPGGVVGSTIAKLFGEEPSQQVAGDLRRFKQVIETGEVVHSDASVHRGMHAAQPPAGQP